jgi:hypothetical protein
VALHAGCEYPKTIARAVITLTGALDVALVAEDRHDPVHARLRHRDGLGDLSEAQGIVRLRQQRQHSQRFRNGVLGGVKRLHFYPSLRSMCVIGFQNPQVERHSVWRNARGFARSIQRSLGDHRRGTPL